MCVSGKLEGRCIVEKSECEVYERKGDLLVFIAVGSCLGGAM